MRAWAVALEGLGWALQQVYNPSLVAPDSTTPKRECGSPTLDNCNKKPL